MRKVLRVSSLVLVFCLSIAGVMAQAPAKDAAPKPPDSPSKVLLDSWNDIGRKLIAMAEDMPEDKYDFKPNPAQRSFAEQLLHAAGANYFFINPARGMDAPKGDPKRADYKTKAAVVEFVKKSFGDSAALIESKGDSGLNDLMVDPFSKNQSRISDFAWGFIEHDGEHYGQLVVYYRTAGLVPPESRPKK
ncbi:MAG TPA: DinB family protein [Terracidiphilus sp.]